MKKKLLTIVILIGVILLWVNGIMGVINFFNLSIPISIIEIIILVPASVTALYTLSLIYSVIKGCFSKLMSKTTNKKFNSNTEIIGHLIGKYWYVILIVLMLIFIYSKLL